jgi:signal transduction histidine kinase
LASILATAALGVAVSGLVSYALQRSAVQHEIDDRLASELKEARRVVAEQDGIGSTQDAVRRIVSVAVPPEDGGSIGLIAGQATFTPGVAEAVRPESLSGFALRVTRETADGTARRGTIVVDGRAYRYAAVPVEVTGDPARGVFAVTIDVGLRLDSVNSTFRAYAILAIGSLIVIGVIGALISGRLLRPIRQLNATAARISADDLDERIPVVGDDDVSALTRTINEMLDRISSGVDQRRALLDDVRHELKAPLSVVRGEFELLDSADPLVVAEAQRVGIEEVDRMAAMVDYLADLTEVQTAAMNWTTIDVGELTDDVFSRATRLSPREWEVSSRAAAALAGDRERLIQAWLQLADNAAKYSAAGTAIEVGSSSDADAVRLWVRDRGTPIPVGDRARIFDRFARGRSATGSKGSGLGLAIVGAIAEAHGGHVELGTGGSGNTFTLVLPRERRRERSGAS